jgi:hypothetical protein
LRERREMTMGDLMLLTMSSVIAYGVTEGLKPLLKYHVRRKAYAQFLTRCVSMSVGGWLGRELGWCDYHVWLGVCGGVLSSWVVAVLKEKVENRLGVSVDDEGGEK